MNNEQLFNIIENVWEQYKKAQVGRTEHQSFLEYLKEKKEEIIK